MVFQKLFLLIVLYSFSWHFAFAQDFYYNRHANLQTFDTDVCKERVLFTMDEAYGAFFIDLAFHPNGRLYGTSREGLLEIDPTTWTLQSYVPWNRFAGPSYYSYIFFDEEGIGLITRQEESGYRGKYDNHLYYYDARDQKVLRHMVYPRSAYNEQIVLYGKIGDYYINKRVLYGQEVRLLDLENLKNVTVATWPLLNDYTTSHISIEYPACSDGPLVIGTSNRLKNDGRFMRFDMKTGEIVYFCEGTTPKITPNIGESATPTDFRRSLLRIDLDADNSSGHITAGYYDTLTTCRKKVPVMDEDIEISTCGAEVDYISFRLKYYDDPWLPEERIYSDEFPGQLVRTSPSRYVWQNPYGADQDKIREYLRSLRYRADWTDPDEKERVVMTTMHVGEDSTTSWSVYQLERDEVFAGRDTTITYCPDDGASLELADYLSAGVSKDGRIDPELSGGGTVFTPGTDADGDYLYILESARRMRRYGCADSGVAGDRLARSRS